MEATVLLLVRSVSKSGLGYLLKLLVLPFKSCTTGATEPINKIIINFARCYISEQLHCEVTQKKMTHLEFHPVH